MQAAQPIPMPTRVGQGTAVEQSRAVAEVQAAIVVAQQCPRDIAGAVAQMNDSCQQKALAERAFFRFPRAGQTVSGPSVHLARELARCWGNVQYGVSELRRDDEIGQSEMQAWAWDVQTNTRSSSTFIVPHKRDTKKEGPKPLTDMRDVYENNANNGARRLREAIFSILPPWFVEEAKELCNKTLADGGGKTVAQRAAEAIAEFQKGGVTRDQLEAKLNRKVASWTHHDIAQLEVIFTSLQRGEVTKDEEFPAERLGDEAFEPAPAPPKPEPTPAEKAADEEWMAGGAS
ncbi:hypothetical protein K1J57_27140 [Nocardiopsis sp. MT53]|uniref:Uncharacterized protein n=2 Tax=Nocardiopsidaceae TaxID=83676 RepID=A0ABX8BVD7_9ACTN|nr:hypothetical protein KGD84_17685 [Nocardiopsis changdeensis]QYX40511.1 hypothetical protein K1J57_27140 [Nocardiopsis sp. MT53]